MCIAAAVAGATVAVGAYGANQQKKAAQSASRAQTQAADAQIAASERQFERVRELLQPFVDAGTGALGQQQALIGLSGPQAQQAAIQALESSPQMRALVQSGENAILQNASATGGLRGGNVQAALAQFRPQVLSSLIENQFARLGGLTSLGQNAAAGVGNAGMQTTSQVNQALANIGSAQAGAALARGQANANLAGSISGGLGMLAGSNLFGGTTPNANSIAAYNNLQGIQFGANTGGASLNNLSLGATF
jgi:hypothetical protein